MKKDLLAEDLIGKFFNEKTLQVAYQKNAGMGYMEPGDHGYVKGMQGYFDLENDMCICRHFDNPLVSLTKKYGFKAIVSDDIPDIANYRQVYYPDFHIKISEVKRLLSIAQRPDKLAKISGKIYIKETKGKQPKVIVTLDKESQKRENLMKEALSYIALIKSEKNEEKIIDHLFSLGTILKKNLFTKDDLKKYIQK